jgi:hypothetical protein
MWYNITILQERSETHTKVTHFSKIVVVKKTIHLVQSISKTSFWLPLCATWATATLYVKRVILHKNRPPCNLFHLLVFYSQFVPTAPTVLTVTQLAHILTIVFQVKHRSCAIDNVCQLCQLWHSKHTFSQILFSCSFAIDNLWQLCQLCQLWYN